MSELRLRRRIIGIDLGKARVGLSVSDELGMLAHPVETIAASGDALNRIARIVQEKNAERVIVGLPRHMNGSMGTGASEAVAFANKLRAMVPCEVITWDERLTTTAANRALRASGRRTRDSRAFVDQVAAQMILQGYLDSLPATEIPDGSES